jgi:hypothetical protein
MSKRLGSAYRSGCVAHWIKVKIPPCARNHVFDALLLANPRRS